MNTETIARDLPIKHLAQILEDKINSSLMLLDSHKHLLVLACARKQQDKIDSIIKDMIITAKQLDSVLFFVKAQNPHYGEIIEALIETKKGK